MLEHGSTRTESSYDIFKNGSFTCARNRESGQIQFKNTDAATVINNAITALTNGGSIIVTEGNYTITTSIKLKSRISIKGSAKSTILKLEDNADCDLITLDNYLVHSTAIESLILYGNKDSNKKGRGIYLDNTGAGYNFVYCDPQHKILNVFINKFPGDGLVLTGDNREAQLVNVYVYWCEGDGFHIGGGDHKLLSCVAGQNGRAGFAIELTNQLVNCKAFGNGINATFRHRGGFYIGTGRNNVLTNCYAQDNYQHGFVLSGSTCISNILVGCSGEANGYSRQSNSAGIYINGAVNCSIIAGVFTDRHLESSKTQDYGIWLTGNSTNCSIINNNLLGNKLESMRNDATGTGNIVKYNIGYRTENGGMATGASPITIPHELVATPTYVLVTAEGSEPCRISYTKDATNITVYHDAGRSITVSWYAEV